VRRRVAQHLRQPDRGERHPRALLAHPRRELVVSRHPVDDARREAAEQSSDECGPLASRELGEPRIAQRAMEHAELALALVVRHPVAHHPARERQPDDARDREARREQRLDLDFEERPHHATRTG
jgi:hypothetical protein